MSSQKQKNTQQPRRRHAQQPRSENPDFKQLVKLTGKWMNYIHHRNNWVDLPKSVASNVEKWVGSIHLPKIEDGQTIYETAVNKIRQAIFEMGKAHLELLADGIHKNLCQIINHDKEWAIRIAGARMRRRLGRRVPDGRVAEYQDETWDMFVDPPEDEMDDLEDVTGTRSAIRTSCPPSPKRPRDAAPRAEPVNRATSSTPINKPRPGDHGGADRTTAVRPQPAQPARKPQATQPTQSAQPAQSTPPAQSAQPTQPAQPIKTAQQTQPAQPERKITDWTGEGKCKAPNKAKKHTNKHKH